MTAPVHEAPGGRLVVRVARPLPEAARRHPLATQTGVDLLVRILAAQQHWRPLTAKQRAVLRRAYRAALAALPDDTPDGTEVPLPDLPADTHPATARSLTRRGLAERVPRRGSPTRPRYRLTPLAVEVVDLADDDRRPIRTATTTGGLL